MAMVTARVAGKIVATFTLDKSGAVELTRGHGEEVSRMFDLAWCDFADDAAGAVRPEITGYVRKDGSRWAVSLVIRYVGGGVRQEMTWDAGVHSGTRGTALYRGILGFTESLAAGTVATRIEREAAERLDLSRAVLATVRREAAPVEPATEAREAGKRESAPKPAKRTRRTRKTAPAAEVCPSTGLTFPAMAEAVAAHYAAGHPVPAEVSSLPDPTVTRSALTGGATRGSDEYRGCMGGGAHAAPNMERTHGKCPACHAYIPLLDTEADDDFRIGSHYEYGLTAPAIPEAHRLKSRSIENVEHGTIPGDAAAADKRRVSESRCVKSGKLSRRKSGGTHPCPTCDRPVELIRKITAKGEKWQIPNHVRPGDSFRRAGADGKAERKVTPRGKGADIGATARKGAGPAFALSRGHGSADGSANVGGVNLAPVQPTRGRLAVAGTMSLPATVRPGMDPGVEGEWCPACEDYKWRAHRGKSVGWRRNHSRRMGGWYAGRDAERAEQKTRETRISRAKIMTELDRAEREGRRASAPAMAPSLAMRKAMRKAASIGSSAAGTLATTGTVVHAQLPLDEAE